MKTLEKKTQKQESIEKLRELVKPGDAVYTIMRHVSRSGMSRSISVILNGQNDVTYLVRRVLDLRFDENNGGVKMGGCGMDMGFSLVYSLGCVLYPSGFDCIGEGCPSNDHFNRENNTHHKDGGYSLRSRWL